LRTRTPRRSNSEHDRQSAQHPAARELIEPAAVAGPEAGSRFQLTIWVDDADAACAHLDAREVELLNGPMDREWEVRTASFTDPASNIWEIAQQLSSADGERWGCMWL
jgi:catechol 2,3-dioxygenase-like lactoylglutathione lyase family enzyme